MGRGKIEIKKIENVNSRQVTFSKRRGGLLKKARELSILCDAQVAVIIFSGTGKLYEFASSRMEQILGRYNQIRDKLELATVEHATNEELESDIIFLKDEIEKLQLINRRLVGKELEELSYNELHNLEQQLTEGILSVKDRKEKVLLEQLEKSKLQEKKIAEQNEALMEKIEELRRHARVASCENRGFLIKESCSTSTHQCRSEKEKEKENEGPSDTSLRLGFSSVDLSGKKRAKDEGTSNNNQSTMIID